LQLITFKEIYFLYVFLFAQSEICGQPNVDFLS